MRTLFRDMWFPAGTRIRIGGGNDELLFLRCRFEGGEIDVGHEVDRQIFCQCLFRGTSFSGQTLSERIAAGCKSTPSETEEAAAGTATRAGKFRS